MKLVIATTRGNDPEVHAVGCADIKRGLKTGKYVGAPWTIDVPEVADAGREFWSDFLAEGSMDEADVQSYTKYLPCTWK